MGEAIDSWVAATEGEAEVGDDGEDADEAVTVRQWWVSDNRAEMDQVREGVHDTIATPEQPVP